MLGYADKALRQASSAEAPGITGIICNCTFLQQAQKIKSRQKDSNNCSSSRSSSTEERF